MSDVLEPPLKLRLMVMPALVALVAVLSACSHDALYSGTLHTTAVNVGSTAGGRVSAVLVSAGDAVRKGQALVRLDDRVAQAAKREAQARFDQAQADASATDAMPQFAAQANAAVDATRAALDVANATLDEMTVRSQVDGVVEAIDLQPGDLLAPGATAAVIDTRADPSVRIYVPQSSLAPFDLGKMVNVRSDALPGQAFTGTVVERDLTAQYTPRDVQTADERADLTFGVKIRIHDPKHRLYGGTTVTVTLP